jgi:hypothetical protein
MATSGGLSIGQIRIQIPQVRGQGVRFRAAGWEGRGDRKHTPVGCSSPAKRPSLDEQRAAQLAQSSVAARKGRPRPRERTEKSRERRVLPHQPDSSCG